ncbi:MAG TPA: Spy/CpxP family protein refolding chaperone [Vicinamibacterales bacterium]|nr:Spy/CpxP family protein refolding chaperone [Vicinamibacterales bacterium]
MTRYFASVFLLTLLGFAGAEGASLCEQQRSDDPKKPQVEARGEDIPRWKWWLHADTRKELRLTDQQSRKINEIWESTAPKQREKWHELEKLEDALAQTIKDSVADVSTVSAQVEKIERLRAEANATRTIMIYRMHLLLTPEQREKVDAMRKRMEEERRRQEERKREEKRDLLR